MGGWSVLFPEAELEQRRPPFSSTTYMPRFWTEGQVVNVEVEFKKQSSQVERWMNQSVLDHFITEDQQRIRIVIHILERQDRFL